MAVLESELHVQIDKNRALTLPQIVAMLIGEMGKVGLRFLDREGNEVAW